MRLDKLTTKFQEALGEAQSLALARDNPYIEPVHVLAAMLAQTWAQYAKPGSPVAQAGGAVNDLVLTLRPGADRATIVGELRQALDDALRRLSPKSEMAKAIAYGRKRWVAGGVRTMICFDPTRGIDIRTKQQIYQLLRDLQQAGQRVWQLLPLQPPDCHGSPYAASSAFAASYSSASCSGYSSSGTGSSRGAIDGRGGGAGGRGWAAC